MQMVKFTHACVRLTEGERSLLLDPGIWAEAEAFEGATTVLITHEHYDHVDVDRLAEACRSGDGLLVYAPDPIASKIAEKMGEPLGGAVTAVSPGQRLNAGGFAVDVVGGLHAEIFEGLPGCANVGYVVDSGNQTVYHPGDSLFVPDIKVDVLLTPVSGPWFKLAEGLDFVRAVAPERAYPIHDRLLTEDIGMPLVDGWFDEMGRTKYFRPALGQAVEL
jgi:L-ascorbate metabolism protein UlaG (beta-lactamase superfamily)